MIVHRLLLWLYPASFRSEYGREMHAIFAKEWREHPHVLARTQLALGAVGDVLHNAPPLHWDILRQDTTIALRAMRRSASLSLTVILVAALGIGATTAAFSLADHVLIKPLPFVDPDRLVKVWQVPPGGGRLQVSPGNFRDWKEQAASFETIGAFTSHSANLVRADDPVRLDGARVSGDLFGVLGIPALLGRPIAPDDDRESAASTVVLSERLWRARFGGDVQALGQTVILNDRPHVIVGVMPSTFGFPARTVDFWIPFQFAPEAYADRSNVYLESVARLAPGVSREQALAEMQEIARSLARIDPEANGRLSTNVIHLRDELSEQSRLLLWCLVAASAGLLLIACTNLANLLLARGLARQRELAVRSALGAGRRRLVRQMLTESVLLAAAGGVAGLGVAVVAMPLAARLVPTTLPIADAPAIDLRLLASATVVTIVSAIGFGLIPAVRMSRQVDTVALNESARTGAGRRTERLRSALVVAQVGASIVLLVSSGLLLRAALNVQRTNPGFRTGGVLRLRTALPLPRYAGVQPRHEFYGRVIDGVKALPGVSEAAYITGLPMVMRGMIWGVTVPGRSEQLPAGQRAVSLRFVTPGLFAALGIPFDRGRDVASSDTMSTLPVAVVSASFITRYWPGLDPLGRTFRIAGDERTIVGVVGDVRVRGLERESEPQVYLPSRQIEDGRLSAYVPQELVVKSTLPAATLVPAVRAIVARADPQQPISDIEPLADIVGAETAPRRVQVRVLGAFAALAFLLAGIGLHGMLAHGVSQRAREIGVRMALGAERRAIVAMVLRRGFTLAAIGIGVGAALAVAAGRSLQALLAGVSPTDAPTFAAAVGLAFLMTLVGSLLPALRAVRVNPLEVMRGD